jgi:prevent-host-death family protein
MRYKFRGKKALKDAAAESIAATDAAKNFGRLVDRVRERGATYVIERHGRPVAQIGPVASEKPKTLGALIEYLRTAPKIDEAALRYMEEGVEFLNRPEVPRNRWER